ncbi:MAG TPA: glycosyltransferase family 87 protein [Candidatus Sulfotelmatobacter sp.]|nr:glycosyltransferase family 87 protein [Candidatus Sulfotelmatobacter sp.]
MVDVNRLRRSWAFWAMVVWVVPMLAVTVMVALDPTKRSVLSLYHTASKAWWDEKSLYTGAGGMNYFPEFAILFAPFHALGRPLGDIAWRWLSAGLLAAGWLQVLRQMDRPGIAKLFFWSSALGIAACLAAIRNGQANAMLAAMMVNAAAFLMQERWWPAAVCLVGAVVSKPLGVVMLLLAPVVYRPLTVPLATITAIFLVAPFAFGSPHYVLSQFRDVGRNLQACLVLTEHRFADINGILRTLGTELPRSVAVPLRVAAGIGTLWLWRLGSRLAEPLRGAFLLSLAASYLMLFNPMNEENSYVILAPAAAIMAVYFLEIDPRPWASRVIGAAIFSIGVLPETFRHLDRKFSLWWDPFMTMVFIATVLVCVLPRREDVPEKVPEPTSAGARS